MRNRAEQKVVLMAVAEEQIEALLDWAEASQLPDMEAIEGKVVEVRQAMGEEMAAAVVNNQASAHLVPGPSCGGCGEEMRYRGQKSKGISSWAGEVEMKRSYYYCDSCGKGLFPPGQTIGAGGAQLERRVGEARGVVERASRQLRGSGGDF